MVNLPGCHNHLHHRRLHHQSCWHPCWPCLVGDQRWSRCASRPTSTTTDASTSTPPCATDVVTCCHSARDRHWTAHHCRLILRNRYGRGLDPRRAAPTTTSTTAAAAATATTTLLGCGSSAPAAIDASEARFAASTSPSSFLQELLLPPLYSQPHQPRSPQRKASAISALWEWYLPRSAFVSTQKPPQWVSDHASPWCRPAPSIKIISVLVVVLWWVVPALCIHV